MRLIDADALLVEIQKKQCDPEYFHNGEDWYVGMCSAELLVEIAPTIEPERKRGEWIECETSEHWKCDQCGERAPIYWDGENMSYTEWLSDFCQNCGADMRGERGGLK